MTNLQIAIEKALDALEPSILQRYEGGKVVEQYTVIPAYIGPLQRRTIELLVDAAVKLEALQRRKTECAYPVPCLQCIHQACGSYKDNALLAPLLEPVNAADQRWAQQKALELGFTPSNAELAQAYAETVP